MATDIGSGLASFGNNLAEGMLQYHKEEEKKRQDIALVDALSRLQLPDPSNPEKTIPVFSKQAQDAWNMMSASEKGKQSGAQAAIGRLLATSQLAILKSAQEARVKAQIGETGLAGEKKKADIALKESRKKKTDVEIAQQMGLLPKIEQPPTGGQIMAEQARQRKERFAERKSILDELHTGTGDKQQFLDPELLLDQSAIKYGTMTKNKVLGVPTGSESFTPVDDASKATHVQIEDGPLLKTKEFNRLQAKAKRWQDLGKPAPQINAPAGAIQILLQDPSPTKKALFDSHFGKGAADTIIAAQRPSPTTTSAPEDTSGESDDTDEEENGAPPSD